MTRVLQNILRNGLMTLRKVSVFLAGVIGLLSDKFRVCLKPGVRSREKIYAERRLTLKISDWG